MDLGLAQNGPPPVDFSFFFYFFFFPSTLHTRPSTSNAELFYVSPARVQIPSRHRCKSTRTTLSCLLFPDSHRMVNLPPSQGFVNRACTGSICAFRGPPFAPPPPTEINTPLSPYGMAKVRPVTKDIEGNEVIFRRFEHFRPFFELFPLP